ncbi:hypothetical protein L3Q82_022649, partial [Scortum barcoo]
RSNMSSRAAAKPKEQEEEEDFYDCQETLEPPDQRGAVEQAREETRQDRGGLEDIRSDRLADTTDITEKERGGKEEAQSDMLQEEAQSDMLQEEAQSDMLQEEAQERHAAGGGAERQPAGGGTGRQAGGGFRFRDEGREHPRGLGLIPSLQFQQVDQEGLLRLPGDSLAAFVSCFIRNGEVAAQVPGINKVKSKSKSKSEEVSAIFTPVNRRAELSSLLDKTIGQPSQGFFPLSLCTCGLSKAPAELRPEGSGIPLDQGTGISQSLVQSRRQQSLTLKEKGNSQFKAGDWLVAERSYKEALGLCPVCFSRERAVLFSNRAAARLHLDLKDEAIADCTRAIELNPDYVRALLRRAELYEQTEKLDEALEDYKKVLERDPNQISARQACMRLPQQILERNEKLKEEMMSKLKDLGNLVLRPFGLSTNNFQVNQDADTGSYSINFIQNPSNNR